ncbi:MAG: hypothetical protein GF313_16145 [Caldithrix sp.]|nr:hypothetical protein [Caldithrix sp.]
MQKVILFKDISPKRFYTWQAMVPVGIIIETLSILYFPATIGYGIMGALFGITGKWLKHHNYWIKILFGIIFWFVGGLFRFYLTNPF